MDPEIFVSASLPGDTAAGGLKSTLRKPLGFPCSRGKRMLRKVPGFPQRCFCIAEVKTV